jgi:hypothetical protein
VLVFRTDSLKGVMVVFPAAVWKIQYYITHWENGVLVRPDSLAAARVLHGHALNIEMPLSANPDHSRHRPDLFSHHRTDRERTHQQSEHVRKTKPPT